MTTFDDLNQLKRLRENVNWKNEEWREIFLKQINPIIRRSQVDQVPKLWEIFQKEEIELLLSDCLSGTSIKYDYRADVKSDFVRLLIRTGYKDEHKVGRDGEPLLYRRTPLLLRGPNQRIDQYAVRDLFKIYDRFDLNYRDNFGFSHFHVACWTGCIDAVEQFLKLGQDPNCIEQTTGNSPLHFALNKPTCHKEVAELLLRRGADPTVANAQGETPLHLICDCSYVEMATLFFELVDETHQPLQINAQDKSGCTPLHYVTDKKLAEMMLRRGADPGLANAQGETPLHRIITYVDDQDLTKLYFEVIDDLGKTVQIDAQDKWGWTPLHTALFCLEPKATEILLERGANPNLADAKGNTPLHFMCQNTKSYKLVEIFFKINDKKHQTVQVDAVDALGRTPLQWAVANLMPYTIDLLLDHGADLSKFVFPNESYFAERISPYNSIELTTRLRLASRAVLVVESLEKRGYELDLSEVLTIMKFFAKEGLFVKSVDLDVDLSVENYFVQEIKETMIKEQISVYDLIQLGPKEAAKQFTCTDYYNFAHTCNKYWSLLDRKTMYTSKACAVRLCEMASRGFFRRCAVYPFWELIHYRLPVEICEMILEELTNEDLYHICLAASGQRASPFSSTARLIIKT